jgi:phosphoribosylpyrophosphate synthetase
VEKIPKPHQQVNKAVALVDAVADASAKEVIVIWPVYNNN